MQRKEFAKKAPSGDASKLSVGIVVAEFNSDVTEHLLAGALDTLKEWLVRESNIYIIRTYGSFELPAALQKLAKRRSLDAAIAIGCIIKGKTSHDMHLARSTMDGLMRVSLDEELPLGLAVLTVDTLAQAKERSRGNANHGASAAVAAVRLALA